MQHITENKTNSTFDPPDSTPTIVPRFDANDPEAYKYLDENGYVVIKEVAGKDEVEKGISLAWDFIEGLGNGISRNDHKTWDSDKWPDPRGKGIMIFDGVGQSEFLWFCRGLPKIREIYSHIWGTKDLITSFDGFCMMRPTEYNSNFVTKGKWYHVDQNGFTKTDKVCIQGLLNFYPAGLEDGGLVVVPKSHLHFNEIFKKFPQLVVRGNYVSIYEKENEEVWKEIINKAGLSPIKVCCQPGDFVLWDSRTVHCNAPALSKRPVPEDGSFLPPRRLVAYVCMTPRDRLDETIKNKRIEAFNKGLTTSHWPEECATTSDSIERDYTPPKLSDDLKKLIPL